MDNAKLSKIFEIDTFRSTLFYKYKNLNFPLLSTGNCKICDLLEENLLRSFKIQLSVR